MVMIRFFYLRICVGYVRTGWVHKERRNATFVRQGAVVVPLSLSYFIKQTFA